MKIVDHGHILLAGGGMWLILSLVGTMLIPYRGGLVAHHLLHVHEPIFPLMDGRQLV